MSTGDESSLQVLDLTVKIALQPYASTDPMAAIKTQLNKLLFKYDEAIGGVPLAYQGFSFPPDKEFGRIYADQPWIYVEVNVAKMLVFSPVQGIALTGTITKVCIVVTMYDNFFLLLLFLVFRFQTITCRC